MKHSTAQEHEGLLEQPHDVEQATSRPKTQFHRIQRQYYSTPRWLRFLFIAIITVLVGRDLFIRIQGDFDYRLKILPTDFADLTPSPEALWPPKDAVLHSNGTDIGDRYIFLRHLGTGNEGSASLYTDVATRSIVVVKTWLGPLKNIRNFLPLHLQPTFADFTTKWPTEIEAGLLLGSSKDLNMSEQAYVPVLDYFVLQGDDEKWQWAMATPFIEGGTLSDLAESSRVQARTPQKLDRIFRPMLNSLLEKLGDLHEAGYCHDDIKSDNIFVPNSTHWLLGDLGNVRHVSHPWHATNRWTRENQIPDCTMNDLRRLLKTYMTFLREACAQQELFDDSFYQEDQAWSQLYWESVRRPVAAPSMLELSFAVESADEEEQKSYDETASNSDQCLRRKIDRELTFWAVTTEIRDWWPFRRC